MFGQADPPSSHSPKPNRIHILKDHLYQVLSDHPSNLRWHIHLVQLNRAIIRNDGEKT
jgi:hypothetical protein